MVRSTSKVARMARSNSSTPSPSPVSNVSKVSLELPSIPPLSFDIGGTFAEFGLIGESGLVDADDTLMRVMSSRDDTTINASSRSLAAAVMDHTVSRSSNPYEDDRPTISTSRRPSEDQQSPSTWSLLYPVMYVGATTCDSKVSQRGLSFKGYPFLTFETGDLLDVLAEEGASSAARAGLFGEEGLVFGRSEEGVLGWTTASSLTALSG